MICQTCGGTLVEESRTTVTEDEARATSANLIAQARSSLAAGGSQAERLVWQTMVDAGPDTDAAGTWAVMECPMGDPSVIVRVQEIPDA